MIQPWVSAGDVFPIASQSALAIALSPKLVIISNLKLCVWLRIGPHFKSPMKCQNRVIPSTCIYIYYIYNYTYVYIYIPSICICILICYQFPHVFNGHKLGHIPLSPILRRTHILRTVTELFGQGTFLSPSLMTNEVPSRIFCCWSTWHCNTRNASEALEMQPGFMIKDQRIAWEVNIWETRSFLSHIWGSSKLSVHPDMQPQLNHYEAQGIVISEVG